MKGSSEDQKTVSRCGYVGIVGRPNVGKSTLLNRLLGQKISITTRKPQTTRHTILGIKTDGNTQAIYVDTPGLHRKGRQALNRYMNRTASAALKDVDIIIFMIDGLQWRDDDELVLSRLRGLSIPIILAVNKVDTIPEKAKLLPWLEELNKKMEFVGIVPISAKRGSNVDDLEKTVIQRLPENPFFFAGDQVTDRSERFFVAEMIREKLMRLLGQELPYALTVEVESFKEEKVKPLIRISAIIWVERQGQKAIVIGKKGERLKEVGQKARRAMERFFERKVFLQLWVKVKEGWTDDEAVLRQFGYTDG